MRACVRACVCVCVCVPKQAIELSVSCCSVGVCCTLVSDNLSPLTVTPSTDITLIADPEVDGITMSQ